MIAQGNHQKSVIFKLEKKKKKIFFITFSLEKQGVALHSGLYNISHPWKTVTSDHGKHVSFCGEFECHKLNSLRHETEQCHRTLGPKLSGINL
jgi:hypothetical protein